MCEFDWLLADTCVKVLERSMIQSSPKPPLRSFLFINIFINIDCQIQPNFSNLSLSAKKKNGAVERVRRTPLLFNIKLNCLFGCLIAIQLAP